MERFERHLESTAPDLLETFRAIQARKPSRTYDDLERAITRRIGKLEEMKEHHFRDTGKKWRRESHPVQPGVPVRFQPEELEKEGIEAAEHMADLVEEANHLAFLRVQLAMHRDNLRQDGAKE